MGIGSTLLLALVLLPGCATYHNMFDDPEEFSHRPPLVLLVSKDDVMSGKAKAKIDMSEIRIGSVSLPDAMEMAQDWRLLVYSLNGNDYIDGDDKFATEKIFYLNNLPLDTLLRVHLDFYAKGASKKDAMRTMGFLALVHTFPEK
ncbi:hypothetical protein AYO43_01820 [Nitrospira sp. SCGC AG-212-E16]|nr:hypothetical protein AYO43_01820 [Nitrospira sp. SCGC AG-212-E16]